MHKRPSQKQECDFGEIPHKTRRGPCLPPTHQASIYSSCKRCWKQDQHYPAEMQFKWPGFLSISLVSAMPRDREDHTDFPTWQSSSPKSCSRSPPRHFLLLCRAALAPQSLQILPHAVLRVMEIDFQTFFSSLQIFKQKQSTVIHFKMLQLNQFLNNVELSSIGSIKQSHAFQYFE